MKVHITHTHSQLYFLVVVYICYLCFSKHRSNNHSHAHNLLAVSIELEVRSVTVKLLSITRSSRIERHTVLLGSPSPMVIVLSLRTSSTRSVLILLYIHFNLYAEVCYALYILYVNCCGEISCIVDSLKIAYYNTLLFLSYC